MYTYKATVVKVYDGDTITCDVDLGFYVTMRKQTFRLAGINAPEVRGDDRPQGIKSRDYLRDLILGKDVVIHTQKDSKGKFGRWLATVETEDGRVVNELLVENGFAVVASY